MMTTYFPSILLLPLPPPSSSLSSSIEAALSVNLTTIFMSKMEGLPPTSDIKMIDIWLILCHLVPFTQVVLLTVMKYLRYGEQEENGALTLKQAEPEKEGAEDDPVEVELKPREAWALKIKYSIKSPLPLLTMIGKIYDFANHFLSPSGDLGIGLV